MEVVEKYIVKFGNLFPVKGAVNSLLYDLHRGTYYEIDELAYKILSTCDRRNISYVVNALNSDYGEKNVRHYIENLEEQEIIFLTSDPLLFPPLSTEWDEPYEITNVIIDIGANTEFVKEKYMYSLSGIRTHTVQVRMFSSNVMLGEVEELLELISLENVQSIELLVPYNLTTKNKDLVDYLSNRFQRITLVIVHSSPENVSWSLSDNKRSLVLHSKSIVSSEDCCGLVDKQLFVVNYKMFTESLIFNSCLNRKMSIDSIGNIKNCPSSRHSYGVVGHLKLNEILGTFGVPIVWNISKDDIEVCRDCEYRYMCTDCRVYIEDESNVYSKPQKCTYDPYSGEWTKSGHGDFSFRNVSKH